MKNLKSALFLSLPSLVKWVLSLRFSSVFVFKFTSVMTVMTVMTSYRTVYVEEFLYTQICFAIRIKCGCVGKIMSLRHYRVFEAL